MKKSGGFNPNYSQHIRTDLIPLINFERDQRLNVLEVGCACGGTLLKIKDLYPNSKLYGIELNEKSAEVASLIGEVSSANIEEGSLDYLESFFDIIIFADVLEHLYDPWRVLGDMKKYLKPNGQVIISLPNIMHSSSIYSLLHGFWTYQDAGIMDRTHVRFFTLYEINKMLLEAGFTNINIQGKTIPSGIVENQFIKQISAFLPEHLIQQFDVYQYLCSVNNNVHLVETLQYVNEHEECREYAVNQLDQYSVPVIIQNIHLMNNVNRSKVFNNLGVYFFESGKHIKVLPFFEEALKLNESDTEALFNIIFFLYFIGESHVASKYEGKLQLIDLVVYEDVIQAISDLSVNV